MDANEIASLYRESSTRGNNPVGLVVKMYDAIIEDLRRAQSAIAQNDIQGRTASLNHALLIIAELQSVLDHARGGEVALRLNGFYNVTRGLIMQANIRSTAAPIEELIGLYLPVRNAWKEAEMQQAAAAAPTQAAEPAKAVAATAGSSNEAPEAEQPHVQWSA